MPQQVEIFIEQLEDNKLRAHCGPETHPAEVKGQYEYFTPETSLTFDILEWTPEKPIIINKFYLGSIDLYIRVDLHIKQSIHLRKNWTWNDFKKEDREFEILIEFKPEINSYSEVLRQVKVYESYFCKPALFVITNSDTSKYKDIFDSQNIALIDINRFERDLNG